MKTMKGVCLLVALLSILLHPGVLVAESPLRIKVAHPIFPVVTGIVQEIELELSGSNLRVGEIFDMELQTTSGMGAILFPAAPAPSGKIRYTVGTPQKLSYRWAGPLPTEWPLEERITVSVPELNISNSTTFSVGFNLRVAEIRLPGLPQAGQFQPVEILIRDTFHPDELLDVLLQNLGIQPEIRLALTEEGTGEVAVKSAHDAAVNKFFGQEAVNSIEVTYPGAEWKPGILGSVGGGFFRWRSVDGRDPGITPPAAGRYRLAVTIKPNTGGVAVFESLSEAFQVEGAANSASGIAGVYGSTIRILSGLDPTTSQKAATDVRGILAAGEVRMAARTLGAYLRTHATPTPAQMLGRYVLALTAGNAVPDLLPYLGDFLVGYDGYGVLILTKGGVQKWRAITQDKSAFTEAPAGRVYTDDRYVVIPFELGRDFVLHLEGSGKGEVDLWKVIPQGVNAKKYPQGGWEKEITVHTARVKPSS